MLALARLAASRPRFRALALTAALAGASPLMAQKLHLVEDVNSAPIGLLYHERLVVSLNGWRYFAREGSGVGAELYRSQIGTGALELVRDLQPGPDGSRPDLLTVHNGQLYFAADDGVHGLELWRSDGTAAGTQMVVDLRPGPLGSMTVMPWTRGSLASAGGELFFAADNGSTGITLWHSDGSAAGTQPVTNGGPNPEQIVSDGATVYYRSQSALRKATAAGATLLKNFYGGPNQLTVYNGAVYFHAALSSTDSYELWKTQGSAASTVLVKDIYAGSGLGLSSYPAMFTVAAGKLFFSADDGLHGRELWVTDGTGAGTALVADIHLGAAHGLDSNIYWRMTSFGGALYFAADDGSRTTLWRSDGSALGTQPVVSGPAAPQLALLGALPEGEVAGSTLYFAADDGAHGIELWSTDGSAAGTAQLADLAPGAESSWPRAFATDGLGGVACLAGSSTQAALWEGHAGAASAVQLADRAVADLPLTGSADPMGVTDLFGRVFVSSWQQGSGYELWSGSAASGLDAIADINPGAGSAFTNADPEATQALPFDALRLGPKLLFLAQTGLQNGLWSTDGTPAGTHKLRDFYFGTTQMYGTALPDAIVFRGRPTGAGYGVWRSDGTAAGTFELLNTIPAFPSRFARLGNSAVFTVDGSLDALWITDGSVSGTRLLMSFPLLSSFGGEWMTTVGKLAFFTINVPGLGAELWRTDGTSAGTQLVKDIRAGSAGSDPQKLVRLGNQLFFTADDGINGRELWRSDGSSAGTVLAADLSGGPSSSSPSDLTAVGERLFFTIGASANQLYVYSQGVAQSLKGFGGQGFGASWLRAIGSEHVFFRGNAGSDSGAELWSSDGTVAGTQLFEDHMLGGLYSQPSEPTLSDGVLYVAIDDFSTGVELRYAYPGATAQSFGSACAASGHLPWLSATDPQIGGSTVLRVRDADIGIAGAIFLGPKVAPSFLGSGCELYLSPASAHAFSGFVTGADGAWTSAPFAIPASPSLIGTQFVLQGIAGPSATQPLGVDVTNGVLLTFQAY